MIRVQTVYLKDIHNHDENYALCLLVSRLL